WRRPQVARAAAVGIPVPGAPGPGGWRVTAHALFDDLHRIDHDVLQRTILRSGGGRPDRVDDVDGGLVLHLAEDRVLALEPVRRGDRDEELRPVRALAEADARVRHREHIGFIEVELRVDLVVEGVTRPAGTGADRVAALDHEVGDHAVEDRAVIQRRVRLLPRLGVGPRAVRFGEFKKGENRRGSVGGVEYYGDVTG